MKSNERPARHASAPSAVPRWGRRAIGLGNIERDLARAERASGGASVSKGIVRVCREDSDPHVRAILLDLLNLAGDQITVVNVKTGARETFGAADLPALSNSRTPYLASARRGRG